MPVFVEADYQNNEMYEPRDNNEIETIFGNNQNEKTKKKKKKGKGLLILGGLLYLTLEILSQ